MTRLLQEAEALLGGGRAWRDRRRAAKKRARTIEYTRGRSKRVQHYRELLRITRATLADLHRLAARLDSDPRAAFWRAKVEPYLPRIAQIIAQTERRVLAGEAVPAGEKLVSLFEPHADIIVKGSEVAYGHKLNLTMGKSGMILDLVVEDGNPADSERLLPMLERHIALFGEPPRQLAAGGGYASRDNLARAKANGVRDVAFHKKSGLKIEDMVRAAGSIAGCATSAPASRPASPASSAPTAWPGATGAGSTTSGPMSGPRWWPTTLPSWSASDPPDACSRFPKQHSDLRTIAHARTLSPRAGQPSWMPSTADFHHETAWAPSTQAP